MMYQSKLAAAIRSNGKVLREFNKDTVYIPYGAEYSVLIKNLNSVRVKVNVTIDGVDVTDGTSLVINSNSELDLERFIKNGNLSKGNKFKFIERTESIENHRGIGIEDGIIKIEYQFERFSPLFWNSGGWQTNVCGSPKPWDSDKWYSTGSPTYGVSVNAVSAVPTKGVLRGTAASCQVTQSNTTSDAGITVPGSASSQTFGTVSDFVTESEKHVMIFKLLGETEDNLIIREPITVKAKPKCQTCGRHNKAHAKFCTECGTSLTIFA